MPRRECKRRREDGGPCRQASLHESEFCFWHDPEHVEAARQARQLGGRQRAKEATIAGAFDLDPLDTTKGVLRLLEIAVNDLLQLDNSIQRVRAMAHLARVLDRVQHTSVLAEEVRLLKSVVLRRGGER